MKPIAPLFDRRIPPALFAALADGGEFAWVTALAREPLTKERPLDLGLRKDPKTPDSARHPLCGNHQGKVLDVKRTADGRFELRSEQKDGLFGPIDLPFNTTWTRPQPLAGLAADMPRIKTRVEAAIEVAPKQRRSEGFLQASVAKAVGAGDRPGRPRDHVQLDQQQGEG